MKLNEWQVLGLGLCIAFTLVECRPRIVLFERKPFNCMKCMCGWCTMAVAVFSGYEWCSLLFLPIGLFVGAMFGAIQMRWL